MLFQLKPALEGNIHGCPHSVISGVKKRFLLNNQKDALIVQIYYVIKLYMFRASSLPISAHFILYIRHW